MGSRNVRDKLFGSAAALFQRFGYAHVSVRDITASIGSPKGTFYNYFKSKEALASAILYQHFDALMEALGQSGSETTGAQLRRHLESIAPSRRKPGVSPLQLISTFSAEGPALLAALYINCWQGAMIRSKCDPSGQEDCLRFALDRLLGASGGGDRNE